MDKNKTNGLVLGLQKGNNDKAEVYRNGHTYLCVPLNIEVILETYETSQLESPTPVKLQRGTESDEDEFTLFLGLAQIFYLQVYESITYLYASSNMWDISSTDETSKLVKSPSNDHALKNIQLISLAADVDHLVRSPLKLLPCPVKQKRELGNQFSFKGGQHHANPTCRTYMRPQTWSKNLLLFLYRIMKRHP
jgi:hypothetical protein